MRQAVGGGCQSGWGRLLSVTSAIEAGTCRQGDSGRAWAGRPEGGPAHTSPPSNAFLGCSLTTITQSSFGIWLGERPRALILTSVPRSLSSTDRLQKLA